MLFESSRNIIARDKWENYVTVYTIAVQSIELTFTRLTKCEADDRVTGATIVAVQQCHLLEHHAWMHLNAPLFNESLVVRLFNEIASAKKKFDKYNIDFFTQVIFM